MALYFTDITALSSTAASIWHLISNLADAVCLVNHKTIKDAASVQIVQHWQQLLTCTDLCETT